MVLLFCQADAVLSVLEEQRGTPGGGGLPIPGRTEPPKRHTLARHVPNQTVRTTAPPHQGPGTWAATPTRTTAIGDVDMRREGDRQARASKEHWD
ncbi:MAG: hypothetical protein LBJ08_06540 [Bifidobacteriaceae bacterium]|jgi:hypothetical protein|nr:hypothetical protein [Bifidobacteriaceae bacterium]